MFGIGGQELILILVVALLVFGPKRLPSLARSLGRGLAEFRRASSDLRHSLSQEPAPENPPKPSPAERIAAPAQPAQPAQAGAPEPQTEPAPAAEAPESKPDPAPAAEAPESKPDPAPAADAPESKPEPKPEPPAKPSEPAGG